MKPIYFLLLIIFLSVNRILYKYKVKECGAGGGRQIKREVERRC